MSSKSELATEELRRLILSGDIAVGDRLPSERKLAAKFGCTQMTVSKAVNRLASEGLIEKRQGSGNYVTQTSKPVSVQFVMEEDGVKLNPIWLAVYETFQLLATESSLDVRCHVLKSGQDEILFQHMDHYDYLVASISLNRRRVEQLTALGKPVIWLEEFFAPGPGSTISFDNFAAGSMAANHLFDLGCRNLLYVRYAVRNSLQDPFWPCQRRLQGIQNAIDNHSEHCNLMTFTWSGDPEMAREQLQTLLRAENGIDGVVCFADSLASRTIGAALGVNRIIPNDLAVIGIDGSPLGEFFIPSFSTVKQSTSKLGTYAFQVLNDMIKGNDLKNEYWVKPSLIIRETTRRNSDSDSSLAVG